MHLTRRIEPSSGKNVLMRMKYFNLFLVFLSLNLSAQDNCYFNHYNKKGGYYLFSTYFQSDMQTRMEGVCESRINGQLYERRVFKNGHIIEEELNFTDIKPRVRYKLDDVPKDSIISRYTEYYENGKLKQQWLFYYNRTGRRCEKMTEYHFNGKISRISHSAWVKESEIETHNKQNYPPHTIDEEGYTTLKVPIGVEETYHDNGKLASRVYHKFVVSEYAYMVSKDGPFVQYYDNGQLHVTGNYKDGKATGKFLNYHYTGQLSEEKYFDNDVSVGTWKGWHPNGKDWYLMIYDPKAVNPFKPVTEIFWTDKGIKTKELILDLQGTGKEKAWYENGTPMMEEDIYMYERYRGMRKDWYANGTLKRYYSKDPKADTLVIENYENGVPKMRSVNIKEFQTLTNLVTEWYPNGIVQSQREQKQYGGGTKLTFQSFYPSGILAEFKEYEEKQVIQESYFPNGRKKRSSFLNDGKLEGNFQLFDSLGNVLEDMSYKNGLRHGTCRIYNAEGKMLFSANYDNGCFIPDAKETILQQKRELETVNPELRKKLKAMAIDMFSRYLISVTTVDVITKEQVKNLAEKLLILHDTWIAQNKQIPFPFLDELPKSPSFHFNLPMSLHDDLTKGAFGNKNTQRLIHVFDSLGWKFPTDWKIQDNYYTAEFTREELYSAQFIYRVFNEWYVNSQMYYDFGLQPEIDYGMKGFSHLPPRLSVYPGFDSTCVQAFSITGYNFKGGFPIFLVYEDGSVEIYNRMHNWEELEILEYYKEPGISWD